MRYRKLGNSGLRVSAVSLGSWLTYGATVGDGECGRIVRAALDAGITLFDTADVYANGAAEEALGRALKGLRRDHLVLASKAFFPMSDSPNDRGLSRKHLTESCDRTLQRLGTDYLDLYQCHRFDEETPLSETVATMGDLIRRGKILYWGTSMWDASQLREACAFCDRMGVPRPVSEQPRYNLLSREIEAEVLPACEELGIGLLVWSPLGQGLLTGKYHRGAEPPAGSRATTEKGGGFLRSYIEKLGGEEAVFGRVERLEKVAVRHGLAPAALALAWCLRRDPVAAVLVGATRPEQLAENVLAADLAWTADLEAAVEQALAPGVPA